MTAGFGGKRNVAAYARRFFGDADQNQTEEALRDYYAAYINSRKGWNFVGFYSDAQISDTQQSAQSQFDIMVSDTLSGNIDIILTKSIAHFAESADKTLKTVLKLKENGISVYFEQENIDTLTVKGEMLTAVMGSWLHNKSRNASDNFIWSTRKRFRDGRFHLSYSTTLGFKKPDDETQNLGIDADEAKTVRRIFTMFADGETYASIAKTLTEEGVETPSGRADKCSTSTIRRILQNEKYTGNALLQKYYSESYLTKKSVPNEGQLPQYWVEGSHEAIVETPLFELVQSEIRRRGALGKKLKSGALLSCRIKCGVCGEYFLAKTWRNNQTVWKCGKRYENAKPCDTPILTENEVKETFIEAYNRLLNDKKRLTESLSAEIDRLSDAPKFETRLKKSERLAQKERLSRLLAQVSRYNAPVTDFDVSVWRARSTI